MKMDNNSGFDNNVLCKKLKNYFKKNIKFALKTREKIFIINKDDKFYEIDIYGSEISLFIESGVGLLNTAH
jgi:hypothetical protein